jgi:hypothetical protein
VTAQRKAVAEAMRDPAELLGNAPAVARKSYVDQWVTADFADRRSWRRAELAVLRLLSA